jgi:protein-tyrosine phosphatase
VTPIDSKMDILMVCTGNICRSPMAEGLLRHMLPDHLRNRVGVASAGTHALVGNPAEAHARAVMADREVDIQNHRARQVDPPMIENAALVLVMEYGQGQWIRDRVPGNESKIILLGEFGSDRHQPEIPDPYGQGTFVYRACARLIQSCLPGVVREIEGLSRQFESVREPIGG